jgi:hypothetical protein
MLTGHRPFAEAYEQAIIYAILNVGPAPVASFDVPAEIDDVVLRSQDIETVRNDLRAPSQILCGAGDEGEQGPRKRPRKATLLKRPALAVAWGSWCWSSPSSSQA